MTKYLDSKGLSYLWQKIVHRFAQRDLTDLSKLANGNVAIWTDAHKLTGKTPKDLAGSVLADEVIALPDGSLVQHVQSGLGTDGNSAGWELNKASSAFGVVATDSPVNSTAGLTPLPIIDGKLYYHKTEEYTHPELNITKIPAEGSTIEHSGSFTIIKGLTFADTENDVEKGHLVGYTTQEITLPKLETKDGEKILHLSSSQKLFTALKLHKVTDENDGTLKLQILGSISGDFGEDVSNTVDYPVVTELDLTELTKDSFLKSATIHTLSTGEDGENTWDVVPEGDGVPTAPGTYIRFEWNTREDDETTAQTETTVEYLDVSRLISVYTAGNGIEISDYAGNDGNGKNAKTISVKVDNQEPSDGSTLVTLNAGINGLSAKVDLSEYQKTSDLVAFTDTELDDIFDAAEELYESETNGEKTKTKNTPAFPEVDPLT